MLAFLTKFPYNLHINYYEEIIMPTTPTLYILNVKELTPKITQKMGNNSIALIGNDSNQCVQVVLVLASGRIEDLDISQNPEVQNFIDTTMEQFLFPDKDENHKVTVNTKKLEEAIDAIVNKLGFRYQKMSISIEKNGRLIIPKKLGEDTHPTIQQSLNNLKPKIKKTTSKKTIIKGWDSLNLIRDLFNSDDAKPYIEDYKLGSKKLKPLEAMSHVLQATDRDYKHLFGRIKRLSKMDFKSSDATTKKNEILDNFKKYCYLNADFDKSHVELVNDWVLNYQKDNDLTANPFIALNVETQVDRGKRFFPSFFSKPKPELQPNSYRLFENFLKKETIPEKLETLMKTMVHPVSDIIDTSDRDNDDSESEKSESKSESHSASKKSTSTSF